MCTYIYIYTYNGYCYSTDYSQQASCLLQTGQLSIYHVSTTSRLASQASWLVIKRGVGRSFLKRRCTTPVGSSA